MENTLLLRFSPRYNLFLFLQRIAPALLLIFYTAGMPVSGWIEWVRSFVFVLVGFYTIYLSLRAFFDISNLLPARLHLFNVMTAFLIMGQAALQYGPGHGNIVNVVMICIGSALLFYQIMIRKGEVKPAIKFLDSDLNITITHRNTVQYDTSELKDIQLQDHKLIISLVNGDKRSLDLSLIANKNEISFFLTSQKSEPTMV